jgi:hypothetical protein
VENRFRHKDLGAFFCLPKQGKRVAFLGISGTYLPKWRNAVDNNQVRKIDQPSHFPAQNDCPGPDHFIRCLRTPFISDAPDLPFGAQ